MTVGQVPFLVVSLVGTLGLGTVIGALVQGRMASSNLAKQLAHDLDTRKLDHQHDLDIRRIEDQQRLRDQRLTRLREGFLSLVQALLQMEDVLESMRRRLDPEPGEETVEWERLLRDANRKADQARAGLLLEKLGEPAIRGYVTLTRQLQVHAENLRTVAMYRSAPTPPAIDVIRDATQQTRADRETIVKSIVDQIRQAQEALEQLEAPIILDLGRSTD